MKRIQPSFSAALISAAIGFPGITQAEQKVDIVPAEITVIGTREEILRAETPGSVSAVAEQVIEVTKPAHPSAVMNRMPGVHVNVTNGEGHMTAIRQPITTKALYLFLEDGIPTRSTGFFNHNALYELNVPQSGGIEVLKGPGTALYGSDAIGAVINVTTRPAPTEKEFSVNTEAGEHGWKRILLTAGDGWEDGGVRADLNITHTDGWRDETDYDRQSGSLRWDHFLNTGATLKTLLSVSNIDQQTAGSSRLLEDDYKHDPTANYTPISYRDVKAVRLSTAYEQEDGDSLFSVTPYLRYNYMEILPNWSLSYDPVVYKTENRSLGLLLKYRKDYEPYRTRLIVGADLDYSPGSRDEYAISPTIVGNIYTDYTRGSDLYDYDVAFSAVSPYLHVETSPSSQLRLTGGLRFDHMSYSYDNNLSELTSGNHRRSDDKRVDFNHLSPKLGATYSFTPSLNGFLSYRHAFRVPSESQLFRQGQAINTVDLDPVKVNNYEIGLRGNNGTDFTYEASIYYMIKKDDILTFRHSDNTRETMNGGETLHRGIELGFNTAITAELDLGVSYSYAKHTYEDWQPRPTIDYSGNEIESAPRTVVNTRLRYRPAVLQGGQAELEWVHLGKYQMDQANTHRYDGHDLLNLRFNYPVSKTLECYGRIINLTDKRYATAATYKAAAFGNPEKFEFAPGLPRTLYAGINYRFY